MFWVPRARPLQNGPAISAIAVNASPLSLTVTTEANAPAFSLQIIQAGTPSQGGGQTSVTHNFIGIPNQTLAIEYSTNLVNWTSLGNHSTGATGSFTVTVNEAGSPNWGSMFFRARYVANP